MLLTFKSDVILAEKTTKNSQKGHCDRKLIGDEQATLVLKIVTKISGSPKSKVRGVLEKPLACQ